MDPRMAEPAARARRVLDGAVARGRTPGLQYLVLEADRVRFAYAAGWADVAARVPMTATTTMMAYSMSKPVTAAAVLRLVADGALGLDDSIQPIVSHPYGSAVTVRQLLSHLSGIPNPIPLRWIHAAARHATFDEHAALAAVLAAHPRRTAPPGARYRYSNIGYWLLGAVVERVAGRPFPAYATARVLAPLGIAAAQLGYTIPDLAHHAHGYLEKYSLLNLAKPLLIDREFIGPYEGRWLRIADHYPNGAAFGGLVGCALGFAPFLQEALRSPTDPFFSGQRTNAGVPVPMTLGWHVGTRDRGARFYYKEGGGGGFHHEMRVYRDAGIATILMSNATGFDVKRCLKQTDRALLP
jgi:D-alanyl-D-alanine carboxypeptidase